MTETTQAATQPRKATVRCPLCGKLNRVNLARVKDRPICGECKRPILIDRPVAVTDADFDRVIGESDVPVLVDFYADWCGPCKMMAPLLDEVAHDRAGETLFLKLDTERNPVVSQRFGIRGIPTLIVFRGGKEAARQTGALPRQGIEALLAGGDGRGG